MLKVHNKGGNINEVVFTWSKQAVDEGWMQQLGGPLTGVAIHSWLLKMTNFPLLNFDKVGMPRI
jgi:hypothetical protein